MRGTSRNRLRRTSGALAIALLALLIGVELGWSGFLRSRSELGPAAWIWSQERTTKPTAIYLARDFVLASRPVQARLRVAADETFLVYVNGRWVGAGRFGLEGPIREYELADLLHTGTNRIVIEARSVTGSGGAAAALWLDESEEPIVVTDESWRVVGRFVPGVIEGTVPLAGEPPRSWGRHPTGRWGGRRPVERGKRLDRLGEQRSAVMQHPVAGTPARLVIDFGVVVEGYLEVWSDLGGSGVPVAYALRREEAERLARREEPVRQGTRLLTVAGSRMWRDSDARRYRWVVLDSPHPIDGARVWLAAASATAPRVTGLWGLEPRLRLP